MRKTHREDGSDWSAWLVRVREVGTSITVVSQQPPAYSWLSCSYFASGGQEQSLILGPESNSYNLVGLEPATKYHVWLSVLGQTGEGPPRKVTAYTGEPPGALTGLWCALPPH